MASTDNIESITPTDEPIAAAKELTTETGELSTETGEPIIETSVETEQSNVFDEEQTEMPDSSNTKQRTNRLECQQKTSTLKQAIKNISVTHKSCLTELQKQTTELSFSKLRAMHKELTEGIEHITALHDDLKKSLGDITPELKLTNEIDRIGADNKSIIGHVLSTMSSASVKQRTSGTKATQSSHGTDLDVENFQPNLTQLAKTHYSSHIDEPQTDSQLHPNREPYELQHSHAPSRSRSSITSYRSSQRSRSSKTSQSLRLKQAEAAAAAAAKHAQLQAEIESQKLKEQSLKLQSQMQKNESLITQAKMKAEIQAENQRQKIFAQAIAEEENVLMRPPSPVGYEVEYQHQAPIANEASLAPVVETDRMAHQIVETPINPQRITQERTATLPGNGFTLDQSPSTTASSQELFADALASAINTIRMKPAEPPVFCGDPLQYIDWKVAFEGLVETAKHSPLQRLTLLQQYLGGKAQETVAGYFRVGTADAYSDAKRKLDRRFGQPHIISEAFRSKLEQWPRIHENDGEGLERISDFLDSCRTAMKNVKELECLKDRRENAKIIEKLPLSVGRKWVAKATQLEKQTKAFPSFNEFCKFVANEDYVATNPLAQALATRAHGNSQVKLQPKSNKPQQRKTSALQTQANMNAMSTDEKVKQHKKKPCQKCERINHSTSDCNELAKLSRDKQMSYIKENSLCFKCIKPRHVANECNNPARCRSCHEQHPTIFHEYITSKGSSKQSPLSKPTKTVPLVKENKDSRADIKEDNIRKNETNDKSKQESGPSNRSVNSNNANSHKQSAARVMSWTIPVYVSSKQRPNHEVLVYALLDSGSNTSFITNKTLDNLTAKVSDTKVKLSTLTDVQGSHVHCKEVNELVIRGFKRQKRLELPACISQTEIPVNPEHIPNAMSVQDWSHLRCISHELISQEESESVHLGLLIGNDLTQAFIPRKVISRADHEPFAKLTDLGWCIMGNTAQTKSNLITVHRAVIEPIERQYVTFQANSGEIQDDLSSRILKVLSSDFKINEHDNHHNAISLEDKRFLEIMHKEVYKDQEGYMTMPLPFKQYPPVNNSKALATNRFKHLKKKLQDPEYSEHYYSFMKQILENGDAELVPDCELDDPHSWYMPHFGVYHPKKPGKIRIVFDGSAKVGGQSLNDFLMQGPDQLSSLIGILMRFRREQVGIACDVERMFHQFRVHKDDRNYLRFLWFDEEGKVVTYRMKVHLFGAKSSPGCATFGFRALCKQSANTYTPAKQFINADFYVDDGLTSVSTPQEAVKLVNEAISICREGNLHLHKFASNSQVFLRSLPDTERNLKEIQLLDADGDFQPNERTLGLIWSIKADCFKFTSQIKENPNTRRGVLSSISSIFDPLGFVSPYILQGKGILQDICRTSAGWDDPLTTNILARWEDWKSSLDDLPLVSIARCYKPTDFGTISKAEVHHFSDASNSGYGAVSYIRLVNSTSKVHCTLLISKAKVTPLKAVTIPRLELQAAVTATQMSAIIRCELGIDVTETFWTDSQIVLGYIKNETKKFHAYVTNRIQQIRDRSNPSSWFYVPTSANPADHASRGLSAGQLATSNWFTGPDFLWHEPVQFPEQPQPSVQVDDPEVKSHTLFAQKDYPSLAKRLERFSDWKKAVKVVSVFLNKLFSIRNTVASLTVTHQKALIVIVRLTQEDYLQEIKLLKQRKPIPQNSPLFKLNPFLDKSGLMRVGGRLVNDDTICFEEKHPAILPRKSHVTKLLLRHFHQEVAHQGRSITLSKIRSAGFWVVNAHAAVSSLIYHCTTCRELRPKLMTPQMAALPEARVTAQPPFTAVGVDCFGPFTVKERRTELKRYGLMVTCLASRAIHIEVLDDLSSSAFINGLRNVIAIRGPIRVVHCDRGTNFVGAISEISEKGTLEFKLNPPNASHMGGVWERMIRTARNVLKSLLKNHGGRLDTSGLRTLLYEVMAIVNSRPLSPVTDEDKPLTPNMLLTMKSDVVLPPPGRYEDADIYCRKRWRAVQHLANVFWHRWRGEYLTQLQARQKWVKETPNLTVGSIVLIKDEDLIRNNWTKCRVVECIKSPDNRVRSVKLLLGNHKSPTKSNKYLTRPVSKVVVLVEGSDNVNKG
ncbi:uncharacterized protein [Watersipora subatra]|uniref:uncharacterized protein n=1 Tax=Watersipora subatra TaxID=2589382 RepID=UPI00355AE2A9